MYEQLMQLPLFQGVSPDLLRELIEKFPFHFLKFAPGETILSRGERCTHARFIVSGSARVVTPCHNLQVELEQTLTAPHVLGAASLFGVDTLYPFSAHALDTCGMLQITKGDYVAMLQSDKVFLFNILNYLSRGAQHFTSSILGLKRGTVDERLASMVCNLAHQGSSDVCLKFKKKDLCSLLGTQPTSLNLCLKKMEQNQLVGLHHTRVDIHDLRALQEFYHLK